MVDDTESSTASGAEGAGEGDTGPRFQLLGPVRAWRGDDEIDLGSAHRRAVLAVLALSVGHTVSRDELIDALWGDEPPTSASGSIYTYVSGLRQALEPGRAKRSGGTVLASVGSGYSLRIDRARVDVHRFTELRTRAASVGGPHAALRDLDAALGLWQGDALTGVPGPFAQAQRARLAELRLAAIESRAELLLEGRPGELVAELTALCQEHPLRERLRVLLMRALHGCGRTAEALDVFADARMALVEASGLEPGPELRRLQQTLLAGEIRTEPAPEPVAEPAWLAHRAGVHVGHKEELAVLRSALSNVLAGHGGALWLNGEPGIGKSALVAEALAGVPVPAKRLRWAAAQEFDSELPLRFIQDCLGVSGDAEQLVESVTTLCADGPLIVVADDLQWADEASMSAWWRLARHADRLPLLLIGCSRPSPSTPTHEKVRRYMNGRTRTLHPLSTVDVYQLAEKLTGAPPAGRLCGWLDDAAGNPYYARKIVATVAGELLGGAGVRQRPDDGSLPPQLVSWVDDHLAFLSAPARAMLRWARLLGREFTLTDLAAAAGQRPAELTEPLDEALTAGVLVAVGDRLRFRHPLVARALYEKTPNAIRVALHLQVAEALIDAGAPAVRVAEQLAASTMSGPLVSTWLPANIGAVAAEEPEIAVRLLRLAVTSAAPDARETLKATLVRLLFWLGREPAAEARSLIARTGDPELVAEMRWVLAYGYWRRGRLDDARREVDRVLSTRLSGAWLARHGLLLAALTKGPPPGPPGLAEYRLLDEDTRAALEHAGSAIPATTWQLAMHRAMPAELHMTNGMNQFWNGRWDAAQAELDIIAASERDPSGYVLRRPVVAVGVAAASAMIAASRADRATALRRLRLARPHVRASGDERLAVLYAARATLAELAGQPHEALDELAPLLDMAELPPPWYRWLPDLARLAVRVADRERTELLHRLIERGPQSLPVEARMILNYCEALLAEDPDGVRDVVAFCQTAGGLDLMRAHALADVAWLLSRRGNAREAQDVLGDALACYREIGAEAAARRAAARMRYSPHALV